MIVYDSHWQSMTVNDSPWHSLTVLDSLWQTLIVLEIHDWIATVSHFWLVYQYSRKVWRERRMYNIHLSKWSVWKITISLYNVWYVTNPFATPFHPPTWPGFKLINLYLSPGNLKGVPKKIRVSFWTQGSKIQNSKVIQTFWNQHILYKYII